MGGLNIGLLGGKSHVFKSEKNVVNFNEQLEIPIPDISKFYYKYRDSKYFVVGQHRVQEFDLQSNAWTVRGFGYQAISKNWLDNHEKA